MGEWLKPAVLKTVYGATRTGVRIPLPPPEISRYFTLAESPADPEQAAGDEPKDVAPNSNSRRPFEAASCHLRKRHVRRRTGQFVCAGNSCVEPQA